MPTRRQPALFISHGAPTIPIDEGAEAKAFLEGLGAALEDEVGRPSAILVLSAHWETDKPTVSAASAPETIHDFYGFPEALYRMRYPAPGAPALARRVVDLLAAAGAEAEADEDRGLDHGAWTPLLLSHPTADVPVLQLSVQPHLGPAHHRALGRALGPLRDEGVLIVGSGAATHNLPEFRGQRPDAPAPDWVRAFADWLQETIEAGDDAALDAWRAAPEGARNHPTPEHFLPLFAALGAGTQGTPGRALHRSYRYGIIAMDCYRFE
ncbi:MAG: class III extradiol ring-cleavage dioxygenase [Marivibrio sp.]|uniref:dioxygenase family protein n=1 Tax=Marivibrio sp. TaxID=2039719 RepID=UPI0032EDC0C5